MRRRRREKRWERRDGGGRRTERDRGKMVFFIGLWRCRKKCPLKNEKLV